MSVSDELRQAAETIAPKPHCGGVGCACDMAAGFERVLRNIADMVEAHPELEFPAALDFARITNAREVSR